MATGDTISLNIGAGAVTNAYEVTASDVNDQIIVLLSPKTVPPESINPGSKIPVPYLINNNDVYSDKNLSEASFLTVPYQYNYQLSSVNIHDDVLGTSLGADRTIFAYTETTLNMKISEAYLLITDTNNNYLYYDYFSTQIPLTSLLFLVDSLKIYRHTGETR